MQKEELIDKFFEKLLQYADGAEKFAVENAPLYIEELLTFGAIEASFWLWISVFFSVLFISTIIIACLAIEDEYAQALTIALCAISFFLSSIALSCNFIDLQKIKHAPRVYVIEQLRK